MNSSLLVLGRPRVSLSYGPIYAEKGSNVSLPLCHVTGHPPPKVTWLKAFSVLPSSRSVIGGNHLTLFSVKKQDSGLYVCKGYNLLGSALGKTQLIVVSLPKFTTTPPPSVTFVLGGTLRLDCQAIADPPAVISWSKENEPLPSDRSQVHDNGSLTITGLKKSDSGNYVCKAVSGGVFHARSVAKVIIKSKYTCFHNEFIVQLLWLRRMLFAVLVLIDHEQRMPIFLHFRNECRGRPGRVRYRKALWDYLKGQDP